MSVKDLFDVAGQVTASGSAALKHAAPATRDADAVAKLKSAGFVVVGRNGENASVLGAGQAVEALVAPPRR